MNADTLKAFFTYLTAFTVVVGGFALMYLTRAEPAASQLQVIVAGFVGSALTFLFVQENSTRTARASERQFAQGTTASNATTESVLAGQATPGAPADGVKPAGG